ncbi:hypothetical protein R1sor_022616 [Riccia sorocarpa]|uniref:CCHC-type domain-containing protein n=1 Tax=Riccia sorocarpa TaxID=122646 RepID=A0ABD3GNP7_9MARC
MSSEKEVTSEGEQQEDERSLRAKRRAAERLQREEELKTKERRWTAPWRKSKRKTSASEPSSSSLNPFPDRTLTTVNLFTLENVTQISSDTERSQATSSSTEAETSTRPRRARTPRHRSRRASPRERSRVTTPARNSRSGGTSPTRQRIDSGSDSETTRNELRDIFERLETITLGQNLQLLEQVVTEAHGQPRLTDEVPDSQDQPDEDEEEHPVTVEDLLIPNPPQATVPSGALTNPFLRLQQNIPVQVTNPIPVFQTIAPVLPVNPILPRVVPVPLPLPNPPNPVPLPIMANPITKQHYNKFRGGAEDEDDYQEADTYIREFEALSLANKEDADDDRKRIFPGLLRDHARNWWTHISKSNANVATWNLIRDAFLKRFREPGYERTVWSKLGNFRRKNKEKLRNYGEHLQVLIDRAGGITSATNTNGVTEPQAATTFINGLDEKLKEFLLERQDDPPTLKNAMDNAEKYEVAHLDRSRKGRDTKKTKSKKKRSKSTSSESSSSSSSSDSSDSSSDSEKDTKKKKNKKKGYDKKVKDKKRMERIIRPVTPPRKDDPVESLRKDMADLKIQLVGNNPTRPRPSYQRPNIWCTTCGRPGHVYTECMSTKTYPVSQLEWVPAWDTYNYYEEDSLYAIQEGPPTPTPIQPMPINRAQGHVAADCDKPPNIKPAVRFAPTPPETKVLTAVNHISWEDEARAEPAEVEWPETMTVMKIETRSKRKANPKEVSSDVPPPGKKDRKKKEKDSSKTKSKADESKTPSATSVTISQQKKTPPNRLPIDIREEVQELIQDEVNPTVPTELPESKKFAEAKTKIKR